MVITGHVKLAALRNVCLELFHEEHGIGQKFVVILQPKDPKNDMQQFLHDPKYSTRVKYLTGDPTDIRDQKRCDLGKAHAVILMANKDASNPEKMDHKNILIGLSMKKYVQENCGRSLKLCMHLIKVESKQHYIQSIENSNTLDQVIIVEEIKMNLLSKSCLALGIITFLSNLISSSGDDLQDEV